MILSQLFEVRRNVVDPRLHPKETFYYYNMPAFDENGQPELVRGSQIDSAKFIVDPGTVLISKLNPRIKRVWHVRNDGLFRSICSTEFVNVVPRKPATTDFLFQLLRSEGVYRLLERNAEGTTNSHVRFKPGFLGQIQLDEIAEEGSWSSIASILNTLDFQLEQTEALIAKYQQIKAGLMHDLFTRGLTPDGHLRPTHAQAPHLYKESPLGWIPKDWKFGVLDGFSDMHNNLRKPISAEVRETMHGEYPYYGPTGILDYINEFLVEGEFCLIGEDGDHFLKFAEWPMTILVGGRFNVNNHAHILSGRNGATTRWLHAFFLNRDITFHLTRQGAGRFKLNKAALKKLPICVPDPAEQYEVLDRIEAAQSSIKAQNRQLDKLRQQKQGLMQDLLTGRVRVKVAEAEVTV